MAENKLVDLSLDFAVKVIGLCNTIKCPASLKDQMLRSASSIGANIHEANYAHSKVDFIAKLQVALKECYETEYWLKLFERTKMLNSDTMSVLQHDCGSIRRMLISSVNTAKEKQGVAEK